MHPLASCRAQVVDLALIIVATQVAGISSASKERVTYWATESQESAAFRAEV
jgi:hypothetical protein